MEKKKKITCLCSDKHLQALKRAEFKVMEVSVSYIGASLDQELGTQGIPVSNRAF